MASAMIVALLLDGLLVALLLGLAWVSLASRDLFRGIVVFIGFGLVLAMLWVRLGAPDLALAEAAIGAGITGALLLATLARLPPVGDALARETSRSGAATDDSSHGHERTDDDDGT